MVQKPAQVVLGNWEKVEPVISRPGTTQKMLLQNLFHDDNEDEGIQNNNSREQKKYLAVRVKRVLLS